MEQLEITVLVENVTNNPRLRAEHGLSMLVSRGEDSILFDCGDSGCFMFNANALGEDLSGVKSVVLSHNHYDHSRGFLKWMNEVSTPYTLYLSRNFFKTCYWDNEMEPGLLTPTVGPLTPQLLQQHFVKWRLVGEDTYELPDFPGAYLLSNIEYLSDFDIPDETDVTDGESGFATDRFSDEQVLAISTDKGLVVLTGCAHCGIANISEAVRRRFGTPPHALIGGTHLISADDKKIDATIRWLDHSGIEFGKFCHCTGEAAFEKMLDAGYERITCGEKIIF